MSCILLGGSPTGLLIILISLSLSLQGIYYTVLSGIWCVGGRESELLAEFPSTQPRGSGCCLFCEHQAWGWDCPPGVPGTDLAAGVQAGVLWAPVLSTSSVSFLGWPQRVNRKLNGCRQQRFTCAVLKVGSRVVHRACSRDRGPRASQPACWWPFWTLRAGRPSLSLPCHTAAFLCLLLSSKDAGLPGLGLSDGFIFASDLLCLKFNKHDLKAFFFLPVSLPHQRFLDFWSFCSEQSMLRLYRDGTVSVPEGCRRPGRAVRLSSAA